MSRREHFRTIRSDELRELPLPSILDARHHALHLFTLTASVVIVRENGERGDAIVTEAPNPQRVEAIAVQADPTINPAEKEASTYSGLLDPVLEIGHERQRIMESLHEALLCGDDAAALEHARRLTGLPRRKSPTSSVST